MPHQCTSCDRVFADGSRDLLSGCPDCDGNTFRYLPGGSAGGDRPQDEPDGEVPRSTTVQDSSVTGTVGHVATTLMDFVAEDADETDPRPEGAEGGADAALFHGESAEDRAQSSARSAIVSRDELPDDAAGLVRTDPEAGGAILDGEIAVGGTSGIAGEDGTAGNLGGQHPRSGRSGADDPSNGDEAAVESAGGDRSSEGAGASAAVDDGEPWQEPDLDELREKLNEQFEGIRVVEPGRYELNIMQLYEREETIIALKEDGRYVIDVPETWLGDESA